MIRDEVYELINVERAYQDKFWGDKYDDSKWSPAEWLNFIERYVESAKGAGTYAATNLDEYRAYQMVALRKIAALAVAAMENNDTPARTMPMMKI
jgi:hypothetical protein